MRITGKIVEPTLSVEGVGALGNQDRNWHVPNPLLISVKIIEGVLRSATEGREVTLAES